MPTDMKIALITYPIETNPTGIGVYVRNIVRSLMELDRHNSYYLLHFTPSRDPIYGTNEILYKHNQRLPVMLSDSLYLSHSAHRFDIVHRFSPGGFIFGKDVKTVITVHDLFLYKRYPFNQKTRNLWAKPLIRSSLNKARMVVADSHFTRREVLDTFRLPEDKVKVVYCAPGIIPRGEGLSVDGFRDRYGITFKYVLFVSTIEPRKNLLGLVKAFEILKKCHQIEEHLLIIGSRGWEYERTLEYIQRSRYSDCIHLMGFVSDEDLAHFYQNAALFIYPSFMEGFGIPPLEAMACGCPVLTSNTSSLPEVVGHEEMMFDPLDIEEMVHKILRVLNDPTHREENIRKGLANARRFSWDASARKLISIYDSL